MEKFLFLIVIIGLIFIIVCFRTLFSISEVVAKAIEAKSEVQPINETVTEPMEEYATSHKMSDDEYIEIEEEKN